MGRFKDIEDLVTAVVFALFCVLALLALCGLAGCACFEHSRVEARADYNIVAKDASVSLVAVGYSD